MKPYYFPVLLMLCCCLSCGDNKTTYENTKRDPKSAVPKSYKMVWNDEFDDTPNGLPSNEWRIETGNHGWGNNELQNYVNCVLETDTVAKIQDGKLIITAYQLEDLYQGSDYISARIKTIQAWKYGYFEMSARLPGGRGTWPAFWMLPQKDSKDWILAGEIDIMEYVGYLPGLAHATIHTKTYHQTKGTAKTASFKVPDAEQEFYTYSLLWTENEIKAYINGESYFSFKNDKTGNRETWPFDQPFYLILNLAIGGDWGGIKGIDPDIFPARYEIDYVRVYQPK